MQNYRVDQKRQISHTSWSWTIEISHWTEIYNVAAYLVLSTKIWLGKSQQLLHQIFIELNFGHLQKYYTHWQCSLGRHLATNKKISFNIVRLDKWDAGRIFFSTPTHLAFFVHLYTTKLLVIDVELKICHVCVWSHVWRWGQIACC